jgi:hypothetical protein
LQSSVDGSHFQKLYNSNCRNSAGRSSYRFTDAVTREATVFYRVKAISRNGYIQYSEVVKVSATGLNGSFEIYPNVISNQRLNIKTADLPVGNYALMLVAANGQQVNLGAMKISGANNQFSISLPVSVATGIYNVVISGDRKFTKQIYVP